MTKVVVNMIIEWAKTDACSTCLERVLWLDSSGGTVIVIPIEDATALPVVRSRIEIESAFREEFAFRRTVDPHAALAVPSRDIPAKHLEIRDNAWEKICRLIKQEPDIYFGDRRKQLILQDPVASKASPKDIYRYLRRFWMRGMIKNALLPGYGNCGASGKERGIKEGRKRGRKPKIAMIDPELTGVNVDDDMKVIFNIAIKRYFNSGERNPLRRAYDQMIENHFYLGHRQQGDVKVPIMPKANEVPTLGQFSYWYNRQNDLIHSIVSRLGRRTYELRHRPVLGNSTQMAFGPGSIFQIDATIADVYLVSAIDRSRIIGRPVVYLCIDVFSRLCVGLYVGLEGPSWLTGMMALANATTDKVSFCAEFGIQITAEEWPCCFLSEQILADRGEFIGISSDQLVDSLNISFANCPPFRGDWKGIVERSFRRANDSFIKWVPGAVRKREHGDADYRLDATLTLHEFTKILILMVIEYNLFNRLDSYPFDRDMMSDGVNPFPIELWNWGVINRTGHLREKSPEVIKLSLLPRDKATVTLQGIRFLGMFYSCERAIREQWFVKARQSGTWSMVASYDPRKIKVIYLHLGDGVLELCQLLPREERFKDLCADEIRDFQEVQKQKSAQHVSRRMQSRAEFNAFTKSIVDNAHDLTEAAKAQQSVSKSKRVKNIRQNREEENARLRDGQAWDLRQSGQDLKERAPAEVVPFPSVDKTAGPEYLTTTKRKKFFEAIERSEREVTTDDPTRE